MVLFTKETNTLIVAKDYGLREGVAAPSLNPDPDSRVMGLIGLRLQQLLVDQLQKLRRFPVLYARRLKEDTHTTCKLRVYS